MERTTTRPTPGGTLWVCGDCLIARECSPTGDEPREPWNLERDTDVTRGLVASRHRRDCAGPGYCECERVAYCSSPCQACGSQLAGERHAFTWWMPGA